MEKTKKIKIWAIIATCLLGCSLALGGTSLGLVLSQNSSSSLVSTKYSLYIGTNDKDTYKPVDDISTCIDKVTSICVKYTDGCTVSEATGYWKDEKGNITTEATVVCMLQDIAKDKVYKICDEVIVELNQNSILIETNNVTSTFYSTNK